MSVFDHGLLYGDGVFEGIRLYGGNVFRLEEHLERFENSAKAILLELPLTRAEWSRAVCETCRVNGLTDGYIRLVVTRGVGDLGLAPWLCSKPSLLRDREQDLALPARVLRERAGDRDRADPADRPGRPAADDQVAQLPEQHPGEDRGQAVRGPRGDHAQRPGLRRRGHGRQRLHRAQGRAADPGRVRRAPSRASPAARSSTSPGTSASRSARPTSRATTCGAPTSASSRARAPR